MSSLLTDLETAGILLEQKAAGVTLAEWKKESFAIRRANLEYISARTDYRTLLEQVTGSNAFKIKDRLNL